MLKYNTIGAPKLSDAKLRLLHVDVFLGRVHAKLRRLVSEEAPAKVVWSLRRSDQNCTHKLGGIHMYANQQDSQSFRKGQGIHMRREQVAPKVHIWLRNEEGCKPTSHALSHTITLHGGKRVFVSSHQTQSRAVRACASQLKRP